METSTVDEREDVQKKTFAKWINSQLVKNNKPLVQDLFQDLRDGEVLLSLLEILTAQQYRRERGRMRVHQLNNVNAALRALETAGLRLVNISGADIVDGNPKLILGLVWSIILHWQVHYHLKDLMSDLQQSNLEKTLLAWCRMHTQNYAGVNIRNFTTSWSDGLALNALLHRWRPQLFDYAAVLRAEPSARLEHAFRLAYHHLGIARLLDPEDVNTEHPDKKSIMMYVMCLFQSLPHSSDELPEPAPDPPAAENTPASRPLSSATTASELGGYGAALEEALAWLLEAEERLAAQPHPPQADLALLKEHFHAHERFLLELSEQQCRVGGVLEEGARLVRDAALSRDEANEVRLQMRLLNERWEQLRLGAMQRQAKVHGALMQAQHQHLQRFRQWLTETEDRMSRIEAEGECDESGEGTEAALRAARELHSDLRRQQPLVDALADCVVVVDDDGHDDAGVAEIEDQLRALGERWSHACQWTLARLARLAQAQRHGDRRRQLQARRPAADRLEDTLKQMEANPVREIGEVLVRIQELQRVKRAVRRERRAVARVLQEADLADSATGGELENELEIALAEEAEALLDRLDALLLILDVQASRIQELGFEIDIDLTDETSDSPTPTEPEVAPDAASVAPAEGDEHHTHTASKKPRLGDEGARDFQAGYRAFDSWARDTQRALQRTQNLLESLESVARGEREEARALADRVQRQVEDQRQDFEHVEEIQRRLAAEPALQEEAQLHAESIVELKRCWEDIQRQLQRLQGTLDLLDDEQKFEDNVSAVRVQLEDARAWRQRMLTDTPSTNQLIHLRNKIRSLKLLESRLKELSAHSIVLLTKSLPPALGDRVRDATRRINEEYDQLQTHLLNKEVEMKLALNQKMDVKHEDQFKALQKKIADIEAQILAEHAVVSSQEDIDKKIDELKRLQTRFGELQSTYDAVVAERRLECGKGSVPDLNLRSSVENLVTKVSDCKTILQQKIHKLENGGRALARLAAACEAAERRVVAGERACAEAARALPGDLSALQQLLDRAPETETELKELQLLLVEAGSAADEVSDVTESRGEGEVAARVREARSLPARVAALRLALPDALQRLREAHARTHRLLEGIDNLECFLHELERQMPSEEECTIRDSAELYRMKTRFQTLKEQCDERTTQFRNLNEEGNEIMLAAETRAAALARRLTHLCALWSRATHTVYERYKVLAEAWHESGELRAWLAQQAAWLDGLQRRLQRRDPRPEHQARPDAEDISDQLYDLENYVQNHSDERLARIQDIGRQLVEAHIMPDWIQAEVDAVTTRWHALREQALERSRELEEEAREAAQCEVHLEQLQQWTGAASARIAARDPRLLSELPAQRDLLHAVRQRADHQRLHDQLQELQEKLDDIEEQTKVAGAVGAVTEAGGAAGGGGGAAGLEARLRRAMGVLLEVQRAASALPPVAPAQPDPDSVRAQLRCCLKFYRTLSEIKSEVESIIKSGRKMVEEKAMLEPQEFSKKIDNLKELYNKLGAQITESKTKLENALLTAREIQNDLHTLKGWLDGLGVVGRQTLELEMSRMQGIRDKLNSNYVEFSKTCEQAYLENLKEQIDDINSRWEKLRRQGVGMGGSSAEAGGGEEDGASELQRFVREAQAQLEAGGVGAAALRRLRTEMRARGPQVSAARDPQLARLWEVTLERLVALEAEGEADGDVLAEYENVTDTIKRRLESSPDADRPELKRSKIPLALKSPMPIKKEVKEGSNRSRGSSLERRNTKAGSPMSDTTSSLMSVDSIESPTSLPSTPETTKKDSSTFNLLKDSNLFTQISNNQVVALRPPRQSDELKSDPYHVVEIREREIVKSTVSPVELKEIYPSEAVETVVEFIPQTVERIEIIDDTEGDSENEETTGCMDLGSEPKSFVVEVKNLEKRMKPTLGILKRRSIEDENPNPIKVIMNVPDLISTVENKNEDASMKTPLPTSIRATGARECPLLGDMAMRQIEVYKNLRMDEVNEYLILDEIPKEQAALPAQSVAENTFSNENLEIVRMIDAEPKIVKKTGVGIGGSTPDRIRRKSTGPADDEAIYSEVEDAPQARVSSASEFDEKEPLSTSTPIKNDEGRQAQVVGVARKAGAHPTHLSDDEHSPPLTSPVPNNKSNSSNNKDKSTVMSSSEKYQKTENYEQEAFEAAAPGGEDSDDGESAERTLCARFPAACARDVSLCRYARAAAGMSRRLHVMLLTVRGVASERDPAKRREILKNQVSGVAPDAAALISRGDSLVYAKHREDPQLAEFLRARLQDELRAQWAGVMSEVDAKRNAAVKAEEDIKELNTLMDGLQKWVKKSESQRNTEEAETLSQEARARGGEAARMRALCSELRAQRVAYPERAAVELADAVEHLSLLHDVTLPDDAAAKTQVIEARVKELERRASSVREAVCGLAAELRAPPLCGRDYDDFPLQEDALAKIKTSMAELQASVHDVELEYQWACAHCVELERAPGRLRAANALRDEWASLRRVHRERYERWMSCQSNWTALYSSLEAAGQLLDRTEDDISTQEFETQMAAVWRQAACARAVGRGVLAACGGRLAGEVRAQLDALEQRAALAQHALQRRTDRETGGEVRTAVPGAGAASERLQRVRELLLTTSANPSDHTSLSIRLSLVKAREEELLEAARELDAQKRESAGATQLAADLQQARQQLGEHREYVVGRLGALARLSGRLDAALQWATASRALLPHRHATTEEVSEHETEITEVLENFKNLERECADAQQSVAGDVRERVLRLRDYWRCIRQHARPAGSSDGGRNMSPLCESRVSSDKCTVTSVCSMVRATGDTTTGGTGAALERRSSADSQASERSVRSRRSWQQQQQQPSGVLLANFDTSVQQIRDWVSLEVDMLRAQPVAVGDVDDILQQLEKQKGVLRELEQKKPQLDELLHTAESLKGTENRQQLHGKVSALREHWDEANARVLQRKAQLDAMLADSQRYEARRRDADAWLSRMEARLAAMAPPAHTADVLEMQLREQKSFHAEVHQYKHQVELFGQLTQRLIAVYRNDDTTRIKRATEAVNHRYNDLNNSIVARGKALHSAVSSLQNFDRSLEKFVGWLSEAESLLDAAERDPHLLKNDIWR